MVYTFGDNQEASRRLRRLAEVYEPETRELLNAVQSLCYDSSFELALDLGCGPGWSTQLIEATLNPKRIVGLEASEAYLAEARSNQPQLEFIQHDMLTIPFPVDNADFIFCRFLLTHLPSPRTALESWAHAARLGAILAIHETEALHSTHPTFSRYYEMVAQMQKHCFMDFAPLVSNCWNGVALRNVTWLTAKSAASFPGVQSVSSDIVLARA